MPMTASNNASNNNDALQDILCKAEKLRLQAHASDLFQKNISFFTGIDPVRYNKYVNYRPNNYQLLIDSNNQLNIINLKTKALVYSDAPKQVAKEQVNQYRDKPFLLYTKLLKSPIYNKKFVHTRRLNASIDAFQKHDIEKNLPSLDKIGFMVALGCGLGYHLEELINEFDIQHLFVYDSEEDFFYASLYCIDWPLICDHFTKKSGTILLQIGNHPQQSINDIISYRKQIGLHNTANTQFFTHFLNKSNTDFNKRFRKQFQLTGADMGYIDDERISLAHTVHNLNQQHPILIDSKTTLKSLPPTILVANGPSLDTQINFIKENQDKAIIISCGSALGTLYKLGVKPDIHVEMERCLNVSQLIEYGTDVEYTKSITLLCLNTVSPVVIDKFKNAFIAAKASDLGSRIILDENPGQAIKILEYCNPTVSNCGLAFIATLGFTEVFLTGTDFGMAKKEEHHTKSSVYCDLEKDEKNKHYADFVKETEYSNQYKVRGNLCKEVYTTQLLENSKRTIEILLHSRPDIRCVNSCNGAFIEGTNPQQVDTLAIENPPIDDKAQLVKSILENSFFTPKGKPIKKAEIKNKYLANIKEIINRFSLPEDNINSFNDLYQEISRLFASLKELQETSPIIYFLLQGSIEQLLALITVFGSRTQTESEFKQCYQTSREELDKLAHEIITLIDNQLFDLDDTLDNFS